MSTATLTAKGQITIPSSIRKLLGLTPHQKVLFVTKDKRVEIVPVKGNILDLYGVFHNPKLKKVEDWQEVRSITRKKITSKRAKES